MRIAQITYSTKPRGGVVHTLALAEALAARGHDVTVWTLGRGGDDAFFRPVDPSVTVSVVPFQARDDETVGERIQRSIAVMGDAFDGGRYDVVHAQDCISANAVGRCIRTIHHLDEFTTPELIACHDRAILQPIARLCVSRAVADDVRAGWGLAPTVIPNGVDAARFETAAGPLGAEGRRSWRDRLGRYVLALGGIEPRKGSIDLLEAYARWRDARSADAEPVELVFGGGETLFDYRPYRAEFEARADALGVTPRILGAVDEAELATLVAEAAALGFVSTKEGFGLAAMEALAASVPVIARDLPVLREVFGDTVTFAADVPAMADELSAVVDHSDAPPADSGRALAFSHDWADVAHAHEEFYASVRGEGDHGQAVDLSHHLGAR